MSHPMMYLGLDVHKDSITLAVLPDGGTAPTRIDQRPNDLPKLKRYLERLAKDGTLRLVYEASSAGFVLPRALRAWGDHGDVIAPSLIPTKPGHQRKHDRYDAAQLARLYRAGELTVVRVPSEADESLRDFVRCRETRPRELLKSRHDLLKFLQRRGLGYRAGRHWTAKHLAWIAPFTGTTSPLAADDLETWREYLALFEYKLGRRDALDARIAECATRPCVATAGQHLQCFRGLKVQGAMVLQTEIGDWHRFDSPRRLMAYLGLVPRDASSGPRERKGSLTTAGNAHCRHVLIQAAWASRHPAKVGPTLKTRQDGQPARVIVHAWKAQQRLPRVFQRLEYRKQSPIAVVAVARELVGFLWAVMRDVEPVTPSMSPFMKAGWVSRGTMAENSRESLCGTPQADGTRVPRSRQLPTDLLHAALVWEHTNQRISAGASSKPPRAPDPPSQHRYPDRREEQLMGP